MISRDIALVEPLRLTRHTSATPSVARWKRAERAAEDRRCRDGGRRDTRVVAVAEWPRLEVAQAQSEWRYVCRKPEPGSSASSLLGAQPPRLPTPYRYKALIERTKQLVGLAQQIEAEYLNALEKFEQAAYRRFEANQGLDLAQAGAKLQGLRVQTA